MKHLTTTLIVLTFLLLNAFEGKSQAQTNSNSKQNIEIGNENIIQKKYKLKGFKQSCCTRLVEYSLEEVTGYIKSKSNVENQELTVWFDKTKCTEEDIKKAINKTAYKIVN